MPPTRGRRGRIYLPPSAGPRPQDGGSGGSARLSATSGITCREPLYGPPCHMGVMDSVKGTFSFTGKKGIGTPLFLEEDGPILGVIDDIFLDKKTGLPSAFRILASGQYLEIPAEAVTQSPGGYVYRSPWFAEADSIVRRLESQELLMPELLFSSIETTEGDRKILESAVARSPALRKLVGQAQELYDSLTPRIDALEKEKFRAVGDLADLAEGLATGRLPKEIHRERFITLKRRLQVLEASLHRAEALRRRLEALPFVALSRRPAPAAPAPAGAAEAAPAGRGYSVSQGAVASGTMVSRPPGAQGEDWRRIKKFRVLKAEKDLRQKEENLRRMEEDLQRTGGFSPDVLDLLAKNSQVLAQAIARGGGPALKQEVERLLAVRAQAAAQAPAAESAALASALTAPGAGKLGGSPPGKSCPLCAEPLTGRETTCPGCQADLRTLEVAKAGTTGPSAGTKFVRGGGATQLGVFLLICAAATFLLYVAVR
jgi:hypothetical protein